MNTVHLIDCMEFMKDIPDKYYELAIVDPPYGIEMDGGNIGYQGFNNFEKKGWDKKRPEAIYFKELIRISQNQIIWGGNYFADLLFASRCFIIWDKGEGFKNRTYAEAELAWTSFDRNIKIFKHDPLCNGDYKGKINPCQKPIPLYKWLLQNYAKPHDKIFDSHVGSGSSRIACYDLGFDFEGCEHDADYHKAQEERYQSHIKQQSLFDTAEIQSLIYKDVK